MNSSTMPTTGKRRVLIFSTSYFPFVGGAEIAVKEITDRLVDYEFDLITARIDSALPKFERVGQVNVFRLGIGVSIFDKLALPWIGAVKALKLHRQYNYDYFWCIMVTFASGAAYIANWFQKSVPIVLTLQEGDSEEWLEKRWFGLINLSWRLALARTYRLIVISNYLLNRAKRLGYKGRVEVIPNGVDIEKFKNHESRIMNQEKIVLITTSRLVKKNGVGDIIESLRYLPENVHLKILGTGPLEFDCKLKIKNWKLEGRVEMLGHVPYNEIPQHLHNADIFVRSSLSEGFGNSFIEAMAAGIPVIATPVGGIPDFLENGSTGLFCEPHNPESIAREVSRLISDKPLRERITTNAFKMVRGHYDWGLIAQEMKSRLFSKV